MTEKYYTPSINEFHVGFECEIKVINGREISWRRQVLRPQDVGVAISKRRDPKMDGPQVRVKYLDQQDIEECGFNYDSTLEYQRKALVVRELRSQNNPWIKIVYHLEQHTCTLEDVEGVMFAGIIKNKSELKKILKMIGI